MPLTRLSRLSLSPRRRAGWSSRASPAARARRRSPYGARAPGTTAGARTFLRRICAEFLSRSGRPTAKRLAVSTPKLLSKPPLLEAQGQMQQPQQTRQADAKFDLSCGDLEQTCGDLERACGDLERSCGDLGRVRVNLDHICGDLERACGDLGRVCGDADRACGDFGRSCGDSERACGIWRMLTVKSASIWRGARAREHHRYRRLHHPSPRHWYTHPRQNQKKRHHRHRWSEERSRCSTGSL